MSNESKPDTERPEVQKLQGRDAQRAEALRANLIRRKTQARERTIHHAKEFDSDA